MDWEQREIYLAIKRGEIETVDQFLINRYNDPNCQENGYGATPFYTACCFGQIEIVKLLLDDRRVDVNKFENVTKQTPFLIACQEGHLEIVKLLLNEKRVNVNIANKYGQTPFYVACRGGRIEIVELLLASDKVMYFNINAPDYQGKTPLNIAEERRKDVKRVFESQERFQQRKQNCEKIVNLLESFNNNPSETKFRLRAKLKLSGINNSLFDVKINFLIPLFLFLLYVISFIQFEDGDAASLFAIVVLLSDCYLDFKNKK